MSCFEDDLYKTIAICSVRLQYEGKPLSTLLNALWILRLYSLAGRNRHYSWPSEPEAVPSNALECFFPWPWIVHVLLSALLNTLGNSSESSRVLCVAVYSLESALHTADTLVSTKFCPPTQIWQTSALLSSPSLPYRLDTQAARQGSCRLTLFVFCLTGIIIICCLMTTGLKTVVSCIFFFLLAFWLCQVRE